MALPVTFTDVLKARKNVYRHLRPTPLFRYPTLDAATGLTLWVKHENHQPVGAFKVRGGVNLLAETPPEVRARGVVAASTGNHGQSVAYAARLFGVPAVIFVPQGANPVKVAAIKALGAEVREVGSSFDDARLTSEAFARARGMRYVHSGDEPLLIAGVATSALEVFETEPEIEVLLVPVGGGSGAAGAAIVAKAVAPQARVIGVQSEAAPAAYLSWKQGRRVEVPARTFAEGLATGSPFDLPQAILRAKLDDFVLVGDGEIKAAIRTYLEQTQNLAEGAGAAALAAAVRYRERFLGKKVAVVLSGGNLAPEKLRAILA